MPLAGTSVPEEVLHAARSDLAQLKEQQEQIEVRITLSLISFACMRVTVL